MGNEDSPKRLQEEAFEAIPNVVWDDYGEDRGLSDLHLIVYDISTQDLDAHIRAHPEDIEKLDLNVRSPLWYASTRGIVEHVRTLVKHGADLKDFSFSSSICCAIQPGYSDMLQELLTSGLLDRSPAMENLESAWPTANFEYFPGTIEEYLAIDRLLIEHGFDVNS